MRKFAFGAIGSVLPDLALFYSKRFTAPLLDFNIVQYGLAVLVFSLVAGLIAAIYPYRKNRARDWDSLVVGILAPAIISSVVSLGDHLSAGEIVGKRLRGPLPSSTQSTPVPGSFIDLIAAI
jgi:peptidoglycan/LPS O-acetylase OafA/YrhL